LVRAVHDAVRGRTRYKVAGVYRCPPLKAYLEDTLSRHRAIRYVSASILTGNVLILFDPAGNPKEIASVLEQAVLNYRKQGPSQALSCGSQTRTGAVAAARTSAARAWKALLGATGQESRPWHLMDTDAVLSLLSSSASDGLSPEAVELNRTKYGFNIFPESVPRSKLSMFLSQFNSLPVALLGAAAVLSALTGGIADAVVVLAVVVINAVIGFVTEIEAEKIIHSLKQLVRPSAQILRASVLTEIPAEKCL